MATSDSYVSKLQRMLVYQLVPTFSHLANHLDYCATNQIAQPQFQDYSDPRGLQPST